MCLLSLSGKSTSLSRLMHAGPSTPRKRRRNSDSTAADEAGRAGQLAEALHLLQRSQAVGESGIEALHAEGEVQELDNTIVGADATIKAWRFMQVGLNHLLPLRPSKHDQDKQIKTHKVKCK